MSVLPFSLAPNCKKGDRRIGKGEVKFPLIQAMKILLGPLGGFRGEMPILIFGMDAYYIRNGAAHYKKGPAGWCRSNTQELTFILCLFRSFTTSAQEQ